MRRFDETRASGAILIALVGCSSSSSSGEADGVDSGSADESGDGATGAMEASSTDGADARTPPVFLPASQYAWLITLDPSLPFGVTAMHSADDAIAGCHWGRAGGPMATTGVYGAGGATTPRGCHGAGDELDDCARDREQPPGDARHLLVYSGLSPVSASATTTNDNGLYEAEVCDSSFTSPAPCPSSAKLFAWTGNSGPVVTDAHANVFVAASIASGATSDVVYGVSNAQTLAGDAVTPPVIAVMNSMGTSSIAAVAPSGASPGWIFALGYDPTDAVYAAPYVESAGALASGGATLPGAIVPGSSATQLSVFSDPDGDLWVAVVTATSGVFLELQRSTP